MFDEIVVNLPTPFMSYVLSSLVKFPIASSTSIIILFLSPTYTSLLYFSFNPNLIIFILPIYLI